MAIADFSFACAVDEVPAYFTYEKETMLIIQSKASAKLAKSDFENIEMFIPALVSHESIHVLISKIENPQTSESLDNIEVIVDTGGRRFQVSINNILFANDDSGIVFL
ncbi:MAG: hypothetical protein M3O24_00825 [Thermoproteota archaeon]|nr:hypothetical protein [Thermoproteota archaeon]